MRECDLDFVLDWRNHPNVSLFMTNPGQISVHEHSEWFLRCNQDPSRRLLIVEEASEPIGFVQFSGVEIDGDSEWGFYVSPYAIKGTGKKLALAALDYAFNTLKLATVWGKVLRHNHRSVKFHERLGFRRKVTSLVGLETLVDDNTPIHFTLSAQVWRKVRGRVGQ